MDEARGRMQFRIDYISPSGPTPYVFGLQLEAGDFALTPTSRLGGVRVATNLSQPRKLKPDGTPDYSLWVFQTLSGEDLTHFSVGQVVELTG